MPKEDKKTKTIVYTVHKRDFLDVVVTACFMLSGASAAQELNLVKWSSLIQTILTWFGV